MPLRSIPDEPSETALVRGWGGCGDRAKRDVEGDDVVNEDWLGSEGADCDVIKGEGEGDGDGEGEGDDEGDGEREERGEGDIFGVKDESSSESSKASWFI